MININPISDFFYEIDSNVELKRKIDIETQLKLLRSKGTEGILNIKTKINMKQFVKLIDFYIDNQMFDDDMISVLRQTNFVDFDSLFSFLRDDYLPVSSIFYLNFIKLNFFQQIELIKEDYSLLSFIYNPDSSIKNEIKKEYLNNNWKQEVLKKITKEQLKTKQDNIIKIKLIDRLEIFNFEDRLVSKYLSQNKVNLSILYDYDFTLTEQRSLFSLYGYDFLKPIKKIHPDLIKELKGDNLLLFKKYSEVFSQKEKEDILRKKPHYIQYLKFPSIKICGICLSKKPKLISSIINLKKTKLIDEKVFNKSMKMAYKFSNHKYLFSELLPKKYHTEDFVLFVLKKNQRDIKYLNEQVVYSLKDTLLNQVKKDVIIERFVYIINNQTIPKNFNNKKISLEQAKQLALGKNLELSNVITKKGETFNFSLSIVDNKVRATIV